MTFIDLLRAAERQNDSLLCVGFDPEPAKFPAALRGDASRIYDFCAAIVDATADLAIAFKPQIAYFAAHRAEDQLERLMAPYNVTSARGKPDFAQENWCYNLGRPVVTAFIEVTKSR